MADVLDELYWAKPEGFTALRTKLVEAAKQRGDAAAAKRISSARKPTTAAWIVNRLALGDNDAKQRLTDLGERLRAAHAAMDGERMRELSTQRRFLVDQLTRAAFDAADVAQPAAALRDDVAATLQAAIADPDVAARLGRLAKAERWSGFGELGSTAPVLSPAPADKATTEPKQRGRKPATREPPGDDLNAASRQREAARAALAAAERAKVDADDAVLEWQADLAAARLHYDQARERLRRAEGELNTAEAAYESAKRASRDAAEAVREAKARLKRRRSGRLLVQGAARHA